MLLAWRLQPIYWLSGYDGAPAATRVDSLLAGKVGAAPATRTLCSSYYAGKLACWDITDSDIGGSPGANRLSRPNDR